VADAKDASGHLQMSAEPGDFIEAPLGYKLESWDPDYPHENFESFLKACIRGLSVGLDVANHNLSGDMTGVNYSSARIAELTERDAWKLLQEWFSASFLVPLFRDWLLSALFYKQITFAQTGNVLPVEKFPKFADAAHFQARRWDWVDPKSDAEASEKLIAARLTSRTAIAAAQGREIEDIFDELEQEEKQMKARGLTPAEPKAAQPVDEPNSDPKPKGEDEEAA
jgi:lambda family phage portal protein